jgi:hypothetical protein
MTNDVRPARGQAFGLGRVVIVVFGALVILQSSQDLGPAKIAYLALASLMVLGSVWNVRGRWHSPVVASARPWLVASGVLAALIALSLPVAIVRGTGISAWLRDAAAYGLLVAAPWLAVDLALSTSRRVVLAMTVAAGAAATVSYALVWLQRRQISDFPIDRLALPSLTLAAGFFAVALALAIAGARHRYWWAAGAAIAIGLLVYSGTRASFVLLLLCPILLAASWLADRSGPLRPRLLISVLPVLAAITIVGAIQLQLAARGGVDGQPTATAGASAATPTSGATGPTTTGPPGTNPSPVPTHNLGERFDSIGTVLSGQDASLQERLSQSRAVWAVFLTSPIVGGGLGVPIPWTDPRGVYHTDNAFTADTPILVFAKFGLLGLLLIGVLGWAVITTVRSLGRGGRATRGSWLATIAFAAALAVLMPFGWQLEDKGTALAVVVVLALGLVEARDARLAARPSGVSHDESALSAANDASSPVASQA